MIAAWGPARWAWGHYCFTHCYARRDRSVVVCAYRSGPHPRVGVPDGTGDAAAPGVPSQVDRLPRSRCRLLLFVVLLIRNHASPPRVAVSFDRAYTRIYYHALIPWVRTHTE